MVQNQLLELSRSCAEQDEKVESGDDITHIFCCDPNLSVCGIDISDHILVETGPNTCKLCDIAWEEEWGCPKRFCFLRGIWRRTFS